MIYLSLPLFQKLLWNYAVIVLPVFFVSFQLQLPKQFCLFFTKADMKIMP
jgi:hypothetical protein